MQGHNYVPILILKNKNDLVDDMSSNSSKSIDLSKDSTEMAEFRTSVMDNLNIKESLKFLLMTTVSQGLFLVKDEDRMANSRISLHSEFTLKERDSGCC